MRQAYAVVSLLVFTTAAPLAAQETPVPPIHIAASSFASTEVHIDQRHIEGKWYAEDASLTAPARIAIAYGQPHARGRTIEGGLIPLDTVWRFGANTATTLHTDVDMKLGGLAIPHGDYSLFLLYTRAGWQLIVNRTTGGWGTEYDRNTDFGRIPIAARTRAEKEETLSVYLAPDAPHPSSGFAELRGSLRIVWGVTELTTTWSVPR